MAVGSATNPRTRLSAIAILLDRGFGKPSQEIEHSGRIESAPIDVSVLEDDELEMAIVLARKLTGFP